MSLLAGCSGLRAQNGEVRTACVTPEANAFITIAEWFPGEVNALGTWARMTSDIKLHGDLIITQSNMRFVPCGEIKGRNDPGVREYPYPEIEMAYRLGDWLFIRGYPDERGLRQFHGFYIERGAEAARLTISELRKHIAAVKSITNLDESTKKQLILISAGEPILQIAVVDREGIGKKAGAGAAGSFLEALGPNALGPYVLIPPVAAVVIVGGAVAGTVQGEREAQRDAQILKVDDPVLVNAVQGMDLSSHLAELVRQLKQNDQSWQMIMDISEKSTHGFHYQNDAMKGVDGAIELAPLIIELRTNRTDRESHGKESKYNLSLLQQVTLFNTFNGEAVAAFAIHVRAGQGTLSEWQRDAGKRFVSAIQDAISEVPKIIASNLPAAVDKLPDVE